MKNPDEDPLSLDGVEILASILGDQLLSSEAPPPPSDPKKARSEDDDKGWEPDLNPTQKEIFDDPAEAILGHAEKGSGKTIGFGHKIVRHAYENNNALVLVITPMIRTGNEGIWHDLDTLILPAWRDGNRDTKGNLIDSGIGLEYTKSSLDPLTKDRHRWIRNRFGGWSKLLLMSIPVASQVETRVAGPAPSMVYVDELDKCNGEEYFTFTSAQLGRRRDISGPQQFTASCNPRGPSHWVYKVFFVDCTIKRDESGNEVEPYTVENGGKKGKDGIVRDPGFSVYHVPMSENEHRLPKGYVARLQRIWSKDPIKWKRLIGGEWIDEPTGDGIFKGYYSENIHKIGDAIKHTGLEPKRGFPIYIGYDIGQVWQGITFLQNIPTMSRSPWIIFDECDHLNEKVLYKMLALEVIDRMRYWRKRVGYPFRYCHITDESAVNQWRPGGEGSYDAWEFEREFNRVAGEFGKAGPDGTIEPAKLLGCPKGPGSVRARVDLIRAKLYQEELYVSATCENSVGMFTGLERDKDSEKPKRSKWIHKFDSIGYVIFKVEFGGDPRLALSIEPQSTVRLLKMR